MSARASRVPVFAVGASAGGVQALRALVARLPADLPAALLIVLHVGSHRSLLPELLSRAGPLPATHADQDEPIAAGRIYVAPPDQHMHVHDGRVRLTRGPKEHFTRPAVDPLFRSVALARGAEAVGVLLSGHLDDGTAGLQAIKAVGGTAIAQEPAEAEAPSMPASAARAVDLDACLPVAAIADLLAGLASAPRRAPAAPGAGQDAARVGIEQALWLQEGETMEMLDAIGVPSRFVCPECGGALWEMSGARPPRYRCHTGHAFTLRTLRHHQATITDAALWTAIRAPKEKQKVLERMVDAGDALADSGEDAAALAAEAGELDRQAAALRGLAERLRTSAPREAAAALAADEAGADSPVDRGT